VCKFAASYNLLAFLRYLLMTKFLRRIQAFHYGTLLYFLCITTVSTAQFGTTPKYITRSTNGNLLETKAADIDNDGDLDVLCTHRNSVIWYSNLGQGVFSNDYELMIVDLPTAASFSGAQFVDLDQDGLPDLAADHFWRKNMGNGVFAPQDSVFKQTLARLCDIDTDGLPDALTRDNQKIYWQRNLGNGNFAPQIVLKNATDPYIYTVADLDLDGKSDFVTVQNNICIWYKNLGNNTFDTTHLLPSAPSGMAFKDLNGNGKMDWLTTVSQTIVWYEFDAFGQKTKIQTIAGTTTQNLYKGGQLSLGDMDDDGDEDLFVGNIGFSNSSRARYFKWETTGLFNTTPVAHNTNVGQHNLSQVIDLDGNGKNDVLVGNTGVGGVSWLQNTAPGVFTNSILLDKRLGIPTEITSADLDNDTDLDLFSVGFAFENLGNGVYSEKQQTNAKGSRSFRGDLDGDGLQDIASPQGDGIVWRRNLGNNQFSTPIEIPGLVTSCKEVGGGDLDNDGDLDLFACNGTEGIPMNARFYWFENNGTGLFTEKLIQSNINKCSGAFPLDADEDGLLDIVLTFFLGEPTQWYRNLGNGNFGTPQGIFSFGAPEPGNIIQRAITDLDVDGRPDFVFSNYGVSNTKVFWYKNLGNATYSTEKIILNLTHQGLQNSLRFAIFDANMDGLPDIVVSNNLRNRLEYLEGTGNGNFAPSVIVYDTLGFDGLYAVAPHDMDNDGRLDLVFGTRNNELKGYNELKWLSNLHSNPPTGLNILTKVQSCNDNGTPLIATDDRIVLQMNVTGNGLSSRYRISTLSGDVFTPDTLWYNQPTFVRLPAGSAGGANQLVTISDIIAPNISKQFNLEGLNTCSPNAPATIHPLQTFVSGCNDNGTPNDPLDDKVTFSLHFRLYNAPTPSTQFTLLSNLGTATSTNTNLIDKGVYGMVMDYELPEGSAGTMPVVLTIKDAASPSITRTINFDNPGVCSVVSTDNPLLVQGIKVYPNPVLEELWVEKLDNSDLDVQIVSITGQVVRSLILSNTVNQIDVSSLPSGLWLLKTSNGGVVKWIKE
jgi:hypothetical protein